MRKSRFSGYPIAAFLRAVRDVRREHQQPVFLKGSEPMNFTIIGSRQSIRHMGANRNGWKNKVRFSNRPRVPGLKRQKPDYKNRNTSYCGLIGVKATTTSMLLFWNDEHVPVPPTADPLSVMLLLPRRTMAPEAQTIPVPL